MVTDGDHGDTVHQDTKPSNWVLGVSVEAKAYEVYVLKSRGAEVLTKDKAVDELYAAIQRAVASIQPMLNFCGKMEALCDSFARARFIMILQPV